MRVVPRTLLSLSLPLAGCLALAGCAGSPDASPLPDAGVAFQGTVHGGQQPVAGASVYLYAAGTGGYAGNGIPASAANASVSLLTSGVLVNNTLHAGVDSNGNYYVTTDAGGNFSITGDYACTAGQQVYLYVTGGNPGAGVNSAAGFLALLGNCPGGNSAFLTQTPVISVDEVSTVAAAYAFAGFATDATHVSTGGSALAATGIANAFATAANLASLSGGYALTTTPAGNGQVPQSTVNTLADILAACVNSNGPGSTGCATLTANARSAGASGTAPVDTAAAAINIAHYPGVNVAALYGLATATSPFQPTLSAQPNDFTLQVQFSGGGQNDPNSVAIDAAGNVWVVGDALAKLSPTGAVLSPANGFANVTEPLDLAIDTGGYVWTTGNNEVIKVTPAGIPVPGSPYTGGGLNNPRGIAIDGKGNAWIANSNALTELNGSTGVPVAANGFLYPFGNQGAYDLAIDTGSNIWVSYSSYSQSGTLNSGLTEFSNAGTAYAKGQFGPKAGMGALAFDAAGNVWVAGYNSISKLSPAGVEAAGSPFTGGGQFGSFNSAIAIDGGGDVWSVNASIQAPYPETLTELNNAGAPLSPSTGYASTLLQFPLGVAIDGSGNVWVASDGTPGIVEFIGAAVPVITPIATGTTNNTLGTRP